MIWTLAALVAGLTWGFWFGRHFGDARGYERGLAEAPLELREQALRVDRCPVCGSVTETGGLGAAPSREVSAAAE
ncbi:MAG: hypothetical protein ACYC5Y_12885 [Symbiobacteriia bacterium]